MFPFSYFLRRKCGEVEFRLLLLSTKTLNSPSLLINVELKEIEIREGKKNRKVPWKINTVRKRYWLRGKKRDEKRQKHERWEGSHEKILPKVSDLGICSLVLGRKVMTNLDSILKSRDISLPTNVHLVKAMVFPVVMYGCENWDIKKAELRSIDAYELWGWRRLESPLDCKEIQPGRPKRINPGFSLEGLMLKLKLQYFGHLIKRTDSLEKTLMLGKTEDRRSRDNRGWDSWMASPTR